MKDDFDHEWMDAHQKGFEDRQDLGFSKQAKKKLSQMYPDVNEDDIELNINPFGSNEKRQLKEKLDIHFYKDIKEGWDDTINEFTSITPEDGKLTVEIQQRYHTLIKTHKIPYFEEAITKIVPKKGMKCVSKVEKEIVMTETDFSMAQLDCTVKKRVAKNRVGIIPKLIEQSSKELSEITEPLFGRSWT